MTVILLYSLDYGVDQSNHFEPCRCVVTNLESSCGHYVRGLRDICLISRQSAKASNSSQPCQSWNLINLQTCNITLHLWQSLSFKEFNRTKNWIWVNGRYLSTKQTAHLCISAAPCAVLPWESLPTSNLCRIPLQENLPPQQPPQTSTPRPHLCLEDPLSVQNLTLLGFCR